MRHKSTRIALLSLAGVALVGLLALAGCQREHPDVKQAVYNALNQNQLRSVEVFQDRRHGEITLRGIVGSEDQKAEANQLARQAAAGYKIKDQISVESAGLAGMEKPAEESASLDSAIEDGFKASLQSNTRLEKENIQYSADQGTLYLKGSVKTAQEKKEAEALAKKVPQVQHVVNDLEVKAS